MTDKIKLIYDIALLQNHFTGKEKFFMDSDNLQIQVQWLSINSKHQGDKKIKMCKRFIISNMLRILKEITFFIDT